jgi:two-component system alkaline phosphatase synthesis response regulator PhoP
MKTILLVDDEEDIRSVIGMQLERLNYNFFEASTGIEAIELLRQHTIDLIVVDWMMPKMTGIELIRALRQNPKTCSIPVILMSGKEEIAEQHTVAALGVSACFEKPFEPKQLIKAIEECLR